METEVIDPEIHWISMGKIWNQGIWSISIYYNDISSRKMIGHLWQDIGIEVWAMNVRKNQGVVHIKIKAWNWRFWPGNWPNFIWKMLNSNCYEWRVRLRLNLSSGGLWNIFHQGVGAESEFVKCQESRWYLWDKPHLQTCPRWAHNPYKCHV